MDSSPAQALRHLVRAQRLAALGTLADGEPHVSLVPFAVLGDGSAFVIHVSQLAAHTRQMLAEPSVSLMVAAGPDPHVPPQATARVTIQARAVPCPPLDARHRAAKAAYLERLPETADLFGFADFSLFLLEPRGARFVGGFAQAKSFSAEGLVAALAGEG